MTDMQDVYSDLKAESDELDALLSGLSAEQWARPTPSEGWTVAGQVAHLTFIAHLMLRSATAPETFGPIVERASADFQGAVDGKLAEYLQQPLPDLLVAWRAAEHDAANALAAVPSGTTVPWLSGPLKPSVLAAAGLLELWAHGQDIRDALGVRREPTDRVGHVAFFGTRTRDTAYRLRGLTPPAEEFRFEFTAPSGVLWAFGPEDAAQKVSGPAADFALLVGRRRHRDDLAVKAEGDEADRWLDIAQAYLGPPGAGRSPGQFTSG
jgi:enediyne biosynthesis protein E11